MTPEDQEFAALAKWWEGQAEQATVPQIRHHAERMVRACQLAHEHLVAPSESTRTFTVPPKLHPATADLVARFATALAEKLHKAEERYDYDDGWSGSAWEEECRSRLYEHLSKGDPRDVANYCAFMWHHGWSTKNAPPGIAERHTKARNEGS